MARLRQCPPSARLLLPALLCAGCPHTPHEGPPPAESAEVASAAPGALGALAAGTPAAPVSLTPKPSPGGGEVPEGPDDEDEDGGAPVPPDAAIETPEDVPL